MLQGCVAGTCWRDQIAECTHLCKSCRDTLQGHVAATHPFVCADTFSLVQHGICAKFVPATCRTEFNLVNFMGHVAATELCMRRHDHRVQGCATCPCSKN